MSNMPLTKYCPQCQQVKPSTDFHKNSTRYDGLASLCKVCKGKINKRYSQTENGQKSLKMRKERYRQSQKGKAKEREYKRSEKTKSSTRLYKRSRAGKLAYLRQRQNNPERFKAREAVVYAVKIGKLPRARTLKCQDCSESAIEYHHWSYEPEHWLDVIPLCKKCHTERHYTI